MDDTFNNSKNWMKINGLKTIQIKVIIMIIKILVKLMGMFLSFYCFCKKVSSKFSYPRPQNPIAYLGSVRTKAML